MQLSLRPIKKRLRKTHLSDEAPANCHFSRILRYKNLAWTETPLNTAAVEKCTLLAAPVIHSLYERFPPHCILCEFSRKNLCRRHAVISLKYSCLLPENVSPAAPCYEVWQIERHSVRCQFFCKKPAEKRLVSGGRYAVRSFKCS